MPLVYQATNKKNGHAYIGMTVKGLAHRQAAHLRRAVYAAKTGLGQRFHMAIVKHGAEAFDWRAVAHFLTREEAAACEVALIAALRYELPRSAIIELCLGKRGRKTVGGKRFVYMEDVS